MNRNERIWLEIGSYLVDYDQIESVSRENNGNARIMTKNGYPLFTDFTYDSVIAEMGKIIHYYGDKYYNLKPLKGEVNHG